MTSSPHSPNFEYFSAVVCGYLVDLAIFILLIESGWSIYLANCVGFVFVHMQCDIDQIICVFRHDLNCFMTGYSLISNTLILFVGLAMLWLLVEQFNWTAIVAKRTANGLIFSQTS